MPTYEYLCAKCGHTFETVQTMSAAPLKTCPEDLCGRKQWGRGKVSRQIGAGAGLIFKGTGFYLTDNRSESYKQGAKNDVVPQKESAPAAETKPAPAPVPKAAAKPTAKPGKK